MGVIPSGAELSRAAVIALLSRLFGDDKDLHEGVTKGEFVELLWAGERARTQWFVSAGSTGVSELVVSIADSHPRRPPGPYRAEAARVVDLLQQLARASGARFVIEEADLTSASLNAVLDLLAPGTVGPQGEEVYEGPPAESGKDYLGRYLAAGADRLALLAGAPVRLDYSRESLGPLWMWAIQFLHLRPADAVKERVGLEDGSVIRRPAAAVLPIWYGRSGTLAPHNWSDESLRVLDALAYYLAECVRRAVPGLTWHVGTGEYQNVAVLAGPGKEYEPISDVLMWLTGKVFYLRRPNPAKPSPPPAGADVEERFDIAVRPSRV